ncbi:MAG: DUF2142 domain-containing protein [Bacillota bacterium]
MNLINYDDRINKLFLKLMFIFGVVFVFVIPPFQMADEDSHFKKAYLVSNLNFFPETNDQGEIGNYIPKAILDSESSHRYLINNINEKYDYTKFYADTTTNANYEEKVFTQYSTSKTHPLLYLPQAFFMFLVKFFSYIFGFSSWGTLSPVTYMYAGRLGNLLFYAGCIYFSLKIIPFFKRLVLLIAIMPMSLGLSASLNYDSMVISMSMLITSFIMYLAYNNSVSSITKNKFLLLCFLSVFLIELKQVYYPLLLLLFLIPGTKFASTKDKIIKIFLILLSGIVAHLLWILISKSGSAAPGDGIYIKDQFIFILTHPFSYIEILMRTIVHLRFFYLNSFIGNLGWLDTNLPPLFIFMFITLLFVVAIVDVNKEIVITIRNKIFYALIFCSIFVLVETSLYLIWTSIPEVGGVGYEIVSGVQGRYFIPFSITGFILLYSNDLFGGYKERISQIINAILMPFCYSSCVLTLLFVIARYWIPASQ